jgi:transcriptional regulator with PAS, ATPase and Fis domain
MWEAFGFATHENAPLVTLSEVETQDWAKEIESMEAEIERLRASEAAAWKTARQQGEQIGILLVENTSHESRTGPDAAEQLRERVKELEEALHKALFVADHMGDILNTNDMAFYDEELEPITKAWTEAKAVSKRTAAPVDRHASLNQDDVNEQQKKGTTKTTSSPS